MSSGLTSSRIWATAFAAALSFSAALPAFQDLPPQETPPLPSPPALLAPEQPPPPQPASTQSPRIEADPGAGLLDSGFRSLYELRFESGRADFLKYQKIHPEDPLGKAAEAASYLFEQFNDKGVLTSNFFLNDSKFLNGIDGNPADNHNAKFLESNRTARAMAKRRLAETPSDPHGLLVLTMTDGMEADYDAIIEKKQMASLSLIKQAEAEAKDVLSIDPNAQDAYVALGAGNYIVGSLPGYKRAIVWFGGVHGDRQRGLDQLQVAATNGHYLQPFAKILLALASERERHHDRAQTLLNELATEFPANPLFARELALLQQQPAGKH